MSKKKAKELRAKLVHLYDPGRYPSYIYPQNSMGNAAVCQPQSRDRSIIISGPQMAMEICYYWGPVELL